MRDWIPEGGPARIRPRQDWIPAPEPVSEPEPKPASEPEFPFYCQYCSRPIKSKVGKISHEKACSENPDNA